MTTIVNCILLLKSFSSRQYITRMLATKCAYEDAIRKLNNLQSNKATLEQIRKDIRIGKECTNLEDMKNYLMRAGVSLAKLDNLSVIHVAGTKGKGSTSAMCEAILRSHGYSTGFYSSPHLVTVCERIRLNGKVISKENFTRYFHQVYNKLEGTKKHEGDMPKYFAFLTVLAFEIFLKEKVDVAIVEVGIGGIVDYTNILRNVPIVGITALGLDHVSILGNTIEEIAEAKAGIMKRGCEAYTVTQPMNAMNVLRKVADKVECDLYTAPDFKNYSFTNPIVLPVNLEAYQMNASLAIQLAHAWMRKNNLGSDMRHTVASNGEITIVNGLSEFKNYTDLVTDKKEAVCIKEVPVKTVKGLMSCKWPGRYQIIKSECVDFYLDGAHTKESMDICAAWFEEHCSSNHQNFLIFSATGDRDVSQLLKSLSVVKFQEVYFVAPKAYNILNDKDDNYSALEKQEYISRCVAYANIWKELQTNHCQNVTVSSCVSEALICIKQRYSKEKLKSVLLTGSLHLVGATLSILDNK